MCTEDCWLDRRYRFGAGGLALYNCGCGCNWGLFRRRLRVIIIVLPYILEHHRWG